MKKLFITAAIATLFSASVFADGTKKSSTTVNVSYTVLNQFSADFSDAKNTVWSVNRNFQKADFVSNDIKMTAFYNLQGEFVALSQVVDSKAIPAKTQKEIAEKYKGYVVKEVFVVQNNTNVNPDADEVAYFVDLKSDTKEVLTKITSEAHIQFYAQVK
jgi:5-enolpyruvylshikimate-3-phosphate synthase